MYNEDIFSPVKDHNHSQFFSAFMLQTTLSDSNVFGWAELCRLKEEKSQNL